MRVLSEVAESNFSVARGVALITSLAVLMASFRSFADARTNVFWFELLIPFICIAIPLSLSILFESRLYALAILLLVGTPIPVFVLTGSYAAVLIPILLFTGLVLLIVERATRGNSLPWEG